MCKKGSKMGGERRLLRGHYNPVNWSRKYPNLQWARVGGTPGKAKLATGEAGKRMKICMRCLKSLNRSRK